MAQLLDAGSQLGAGLAGNRSRHVIVAILIDLLVPVVGVPRIVQVVVLAIQPDQLSHIPLLQGSVVSLPPIRSLNLLLASFAK